ncbi:hypothetical protein MCOR07_006960 [Pyricularia oryzae]|uniref:Uncharacterized protein n=6 Tax=Pyricularia TaxID=48558 RepID=A0ABQ8NSD7_PYRGI|nr:uncharacterized protein MGG_06081 [Pyricularia oryzae 70-15]KAI6259966.1 hypothetical protein MCOR19_003690 [Pyricularia oryzae]KAI6300891.1 hypothetical protein MCOR33_003515 [Pyricularia grisea]EHA52139.1 hypothetical protein MGG_06081 [Pyricularia oryzae 70-15]KAI6285505.1 hypothetical protein MCOR26_001480 [Pyricularia oryzae]KAI6321286.1 hypothetical protein MCOR29_005059 [Pyricularia oryzae]
MGSSKNAGRRRSVSKMDPDCAICRRPATVRCDCEAKGLEEAVRQAEVKLMSRVYEDIREWVRGRAQDYVLSVYHKQAERRKQDHAKHIERITAHSYHHFHRPPHPNEIVAAQATLKRGIDGDWQAAVYRYPEVLEYFYGLVNITLPRDSDPEVRHPPLDSPPSHKRVGRRGSGGGPGTVASVSFAPPPPPLEEERRTPGPPSRRHSYRPPPGPPPGPPSPYHTQYY